MKKRVITISRQFGSGGHSIGKSVAEQLGIPYYDKEILGRIASETGFALSFIENASEYATSNNSFLWNLVMKHSSPHVPEENPVDVIYFTQAKIIKEIAGKESCVIVGRCSDYILRDREDCLHIFICADKESRAKRILENYGETDKTIGKRIDDKDARRKIYYTHYTDRVWGSPENYHAMLNSGELGEELCVRIIRELYQSE